MSKYGPIGPDDPRHGTYNAYVNLSCRCIPCTDANNARCWNYRSRKGRLGIHGPRQRRHGTTTEYVKHRCRCTQCRSAAAAYQRRYRAARR